MIEERNEILESGLESDLEESLEERFRGGLEGFCVEMIHVLNEEDGNVSI